MKVQHFQICIARVSENKAPITIKDFAFTKQDVQLVPRAANTKQLDKVPLPGWQLEHAIAK